MMEIRKLPLDVQTFLRTGITVTDISQCVLELVHNALDAESTSIAVRVDLEKFSIQVVDNGKGLTKDELDLIGIRYMTSKISSLKDLKMNTKHYGFRGEALASLREACGVLLVISRAKESEETYSKVFRANKADQRATISAHKRLCVGTTVVVRDLLHNLPVRRARVQPAIELEDLRHALIALSIINYKVSFTLRNDITKMVILQTEEYSDLCDALKHHCNIRGDHCLISNTVHLQPFKVFAHISRETEPSKRFQFIYVNGRLVRNKYMNKLMNQKLSKSFYLRNIGKEVKNEHDNIKEKSYPVFVINIHCPYTEYDITSDPRKLMVEFRKWDIVTKCLERTVDKFVSTESNLNVSTKHVPELPQKDLYVSKNYNIIEENPHTSNVMYGSSVKRTAAESEHLDKEIPFNLNQNVNKRVAADQSLEDDNDRVNIIQINELGGEEKNCSNDNQEKVDTPISTDMRHNDNYELVQSSVKTVLRETSNESADNFRNHSVTSILSELRSEKSTNNEKNWSSKSYNEVNVICKKRLTEHIVTESETENTPKKKLCRPIQNNSVSLRKYVKHRSAIPGLKMISDNEKQFEVPHKISSSSKRKFQNEHIVTESESEEISSVKTSAWPSTILKNINKTRKSILPIQCQDFFDNALKSMALATDVLFHNKANETPQQKVQIDLYRSVKEDRKNNSFKFTQKNTLKYVDNDKGFYFNCNESSQSKIIAKNASIERAKNVLNSVKLNITSNTSMKELDNITNNVEKKITLVNHKKRSYMTLKENWRLFSPTFKKPKYIRNNTPLPTKRLPMKFNQLIDFSKGLDRSMKCKRKIKGNFLNIPNSNLSKNNNYKSTKNTKLLKEHIRKRPLKLQTHRTITTHNLIDKSPKGILKTSVSIQRKSNDTSKKTSNLGTLEENEFLSKYLNTHNIHEQQKRSLNLQPSYPVNNKVFSEKYQNNVYNTCHYTHLATTINSKENEHKSRESGSFKQLSNNSCNGITTNTSRYFYPIFPGVHPTKTSTNYFNIPEAFLGGNKETHFNLDYENTKSVKKTYQYSPTYHKQYASEMVSGSICYKQNDIKSFNLFNSSAHLENPPSKDIFVSALTNSANKNSNLNVPYLESTKQLSSFTQNVDGNLQTNSETSNTKIVNEETEEPKVIGGHINSSKYNLEDTLNTTMQNEEIQRPADVVKKKIEADIDCPSNDIYSFEENAASIVNSNKIHYINQDIESHSGRENITAANNNIEEQPPSDASHSGRENVDAVNNNIEQEPTLATNSKSCSQTQNCHPTIQNWNVETMPNGKIIYINPITGMSSFSSPTDGCKSLYFISNRHWFMPKGTSPLLLFKKPNDTNIKLLTDNEKDVVQDIVISNNATDLATIKWKNNTRGNMEEVLNMLSEECTNTEWLPQMWQLQKPCSFSSGSLSNAKVLGQVDGKFIAALLKPNEQTNPFLVLFDQHAVDERIRLESLITGYKQSDGHLIKRSLNPPVEISLSESERAMLTEILPKIPKLGLELKVQQLKIVVYGVPICLFNRAIRENQEEVLNNMITAFIKQLLKLSEDFRGVIPSLPAFISDIINSEACRGAIKFGDVLSLEKCKLLVSKLALCEVPFQCAHGRPVLTPLLEIEKPKVEIEPINLRRLVRWRHSKKNR